MGKCQHQSTGGILVAQRGVERLSVEQVKTLGISRLSVEKYNPHAGVRMCMRRGFRASASAKGGVE